MLGKLFNRRLKVHGTVHIKKILPKYCLLRKACYTWHRFYYLLNLNYANKFLSSSSFCYKYENICLRFAKNNCRKPFRVPFKTYGRDKNKNTTQNKNTAHTGKTFTNLIRACSRPFSVLSGILACHTSYSVIQSIHKFGSTKSRSRLREVRIFAGRFGLNYRICLVVFLVVCCVELLDLSVFSDI